MTSVSFPGDIWKPWVVYLPFLLLSFPGVNSSFFSPLASILFYFSIKMNRDCPGLAGVAGGEVGGRVEGIIEWCLFRQPVVSSACSLLCVSGAHARELRGPLGCSARQCLRDQHCSSTCFFFYVTFRSSRGGQPLAARAPKWQDSQVIPPFDSLVGGVSRAGGRPCPGTRSRHVLIAVVVVSLGRKSIPRFFLVPVCVCSCVKCETPSSRNVETSCRRCSG